MINDEAPLASFWEHIHVLRGVIFKAFFGIFAMMSVCLFFYPNLYELLTEPLQKKAPQDVIEQKITKTQITNPTEKPIRYALNQKSVAGFSEGSYLSDPATAIIAPYGYILLEERSKSIPLYFLSPLEGFILSLKLSFWAAVVLSFPYWGFLLARFAWPALKGSEKQLLIPFAFLSTLFLSTGALFAYYITIPYANEYLLSYSEGLGENLWSASTYLQFTFTLLFASAAAFELAVILLFLVHFGIISTQAMIEKRRHAIVLAFIVAALLTPPDIFTQFCLAIPLIILYEGAILYGRLRELSKKRVII